MFLRGFIHPLSDKLDIILDFDRLKPFRSDFVSITSIAKSKRPQVVKIFNFQQPIIIGIYKSV